jgi:hypothetical protein
MTDHCATTAENSSRFWCLDCGRMTGYTEIIRESPLSCLPTIRPECGIAAVPRGLRVLYGDPPAYFPCGIGK